MWIGFEQTEPPAHRFAVRQISGMLARRIVCTLAARADRHTRRNLWYDKARLTNRADPAGRRRGNHGQARRSGPRRQPYRRPLEIAACGLAIRNRESPIDETNSRRSRVADAVHARQSDLRILRDRRPLAHRAAGLGPSSSRRPSIKLDQSKDLPESARELIDSDDPTHNLMLCGALILLAMLFDAVDGQVARITRATSDFGAQLDSLCDLVSFGLAPAILLVKMCPQFSYWHRDAIWCIAAVFACCAALRLARFNVESDSDDDHTMFAGLPTPAAAAAIGSFAILSYSLRNEDAVVTNENFQLYDLWMQRLVPLFAVIISRPHGLAPSLSPSAHAIRPRPAFLRTAHCNRVLAHGDPHRVELCDPALVRRLRVLAAGEISLEPRLAPPSAGRIAVLVGQASA